MWFFLLLKKFQHVIPQLHLEGVIEIYAGITHYFVIIYLFIKLKLTVICKNKMDYTGYFRIKYCKLEDLFNKKSFHFTE